jgi:hypothetical protein
MQIEKLTFWTVNLLNQFEASYVSIKLYTAVDAGNAPAGAAVTEPGRNAKSAEATRDSVDIALNSKYFTRIEICMYSMSKSI